MPVPKPEMRAWTSLLASTLSMRAFSTLRILPRIGRIAWLCGLRPRTAEPPAESPSTMKTSLIVGSLLWQSRSLPGSPPGRRRLDRLAHDVAPLGRVPAQPVAELVGHGPLDEALDLGVAQLGLGLALELRLGELDRDNGRQALTDVVTGEVLVLLLE